MCLGSVKVFLKVPLKYFSRSGFCAELQLKQVLCIMCVPTLTIVTSAYSWPDSRHSSPGLSSTISDSRSAFCAELQLKRVLCILCVPMLSIVTSATLTIVKSAYSWPDSRHSGPESQFSMHFQSGFLLISRPTLAPKIHLNRSGIDARYLPINFWIV